MRSGDARITPSCRRCSARSRVIMRPDFRMERDLNAAGLARRRWRHCRALAAGLAALCLTASALGAERFELFPDAVPASEYFRDDAAVMRELTAGIAEPQQAQPQPALEPTPAKVPFWEM